jgi:hypothetical protein
MTQTRNAVLIVTVESLLKSDENLRGLAFGEMESTIQERHLLPILFELLDRLIKRYSVWKSPDGTVTVRVYDGSSREMTFHLKDGEFSLPDITYSDNPIPDQAIEIPNCVSEYTHCERRCGCGCLIDMGYLKYEHTHLDIKHGKHCEGKPE